MTFANCGWKWEDVQVIDANIIESIPTGKEFSNYSLHEDTFPHPYQTGECWISKDQRVIRRFIDGTLLQVEFKYWPSAGSHTIYLLEDGKKRAFISREVFEGLGYRFNQGEVNNWKSNITQVSEEEFYQYSIGELITMDNPPKNKQKNTEQSQNSQTEKSSIVTEFTNSDSNYDEKDKKEKEDDFVSPIPRKNIVAYAVKEIANIAERNGEIGQEMEATIQTQTQNQEKLEAGIQKIKSRGRVAKFFIGPDYSEAKKAKRILEQNEEQIQKLNEIRTQIINQGEQLQIIEQIQVLEKVNEETENLLNEAKKGFSLFGWLFNLFSR